MSTRPNTTSAFPARRRNARPTQWWVRVVTGFALLVGAGVTLAMLVAVFGMVVGYEFSPQLLSRRQFVYYHIPLLRIQVTPVFRDDVSNDLELHLRSQAYLPKTVRPTARWDVVETLRHGSIQRRGDAGILCKYLDATDDAGELRWLVWTKENPQLAEILWPAVARVARQELYFLAPDLFHVADGGGDAKPFQQRLDHALAHSYQNLGDIYRQLGQHDLAVQQYSEALLVDPQFVAALRGRSVALQDLGRHEQAAADVRAADEIQRPRAKSGG